MADSARTHGSQIYLSRNVKQVAPSAVAGGGGAAGNWVADATAKGATHVYLFNNTTTEHEDQSGNGYDLTPPGGDYSGSLTAGGPFTNYIDMSGFSDAWDRTEAADDLNPNIYSVEMIFLQAATASIVYLAGNDSGSGSTRPWIMQLAAADGDLQAFGNNQAGPVFTSEGSGLDDGAWHHVVFTHSWVDGHTNHYIDGTQTITDGAGSTSKQTNTTMCVGSQRPFTNLFQGGIAGFAYYSGVELSSADVTSLYGSTGL